MVPGTLYIIAATLLAAASVSQPGDVPPDLVGRDVDHHLVHLSDYRGKIVVMDFWASWCSPCRKELSLLDGIQKQVSTDKLVVLAVNYRESRQVFTRIAHKLADQLSVTLVEDSEGRASGPYGIKAIPFIVLIGRDGKVIEIKHGYSEADIEPFIGRLNDLLREPAASSTHDL